MIAAFKKAKWIWENKQDNFNEYINFIDDFRSDSDTGKVILKISVDTNYQVYVNGQAAGFGQYADYPFYKVFDELDITQFVEKGENSIAIIGYYHGVDASTYYKNKPGLIFEITSGESVLLSSSEKTLSRKARDYKSGEMEEITGQIGFTYHYDARMEDGWNEKGYVPTDGWKNSVPVDFDNKLFPRPVKKLLLDSCVKGFITSQGIFAENLNIRGDVNSKRKSDCNGDNNSNSNGESDSESVNDNNNNISNTDEINTTAFRMQNSFMAYRNLHSIAGVSPKQYFPVNEGIEFSCEDGDGIYIIIDLEREVAGGLFLDIDAPAGTLVDVGFGEHLDDLRVRTYIGGRNFALSYMCKDGRNTFCNHLRRLGCRYLQLNVHAGKFVLYNAGIIPQYYPLNVKSNTMSDKLNDKIYHTCVETLRICMHEHYEDTPWREQALYSMDSRNQMLCGYYAFEEFEFAKASLKLMILSEKKDRQLSLCSPAKHPLTIPCFTLVWFLQLYEYVIYSKDLDFAKEVYPQATAILDAFINRIDETGLILEYEEKGYWNFYEWTEGLDGSGTGNVRRYSSILNAFLSIALDSFSKISYMTGRNAESDRYKSISEDVNRAVDSKFWEDKNKAYLSFVGENQTPHFAELTQSLIIYSGACPDSKLHDLMELLTRPDSMLNKISLSHSIFKYDALMINNPRKYAKYVEDDIAKQWGEMLFNKATTFWETKDGGWAFNNAGSLSHAWSAVPLYIYKKYGFQ